MTGMERRSAWRRPCRENVEHWLRNLSGSVATCSDVRHTRSSAPFPPLSRDTASTGNRPPEDTCEVSLLRWDTAGVGRRHFVGRRHAPAFARRRPDSRADRRRCRRTSTVRGSGKTSCAYRRRRDRTKGQRKGTQAICRTRSQIVEERKNVTCRPLWVVCHADRQRPGRGPLGFIGQGSANFGGTEACRVLGSPSPRHCTQPVVADCPRSLTLRTSHYHIVCALDRMSSSILSTNSSI